MSEVEVFSGTSEVRISESACPERRGLCSFTSHAVDGLGISLRTRIKYSGAEVTVRVWQICWIFGSDYNPLCLER